MDTTLNLEICLYRCKDNTNPLAMAPGLKNYFITVTEAMKDIGTYRLIKLMQPDAGDTAQLHIPNKLAMEHGVSLEFWTSANPVNGDDITPLGILVLYREGGGIRVEAPEPNEYLGFCRAKNMHRFLLRGSAVSYNICVNTSDIKPRNKASLENSL